MDRKYSGIHLLIFISFILFATSPWSYDKFFNSKEHVYLVKLKRLPQFSENGIGLTVFDKLIKENESRIQDLYPDRNEGELGRWVVVTDKDDILATLLANKEDVEEVEDGNMKFEIQSTGLENLFSFFSSKPVSKEKEVINDDKTWGLRIPKVAEGLKALKPTRKVTVAVIDTGCDLKHPSLEGKFVPGHNFAGGDENDPSNREPYEAHATHVTGTIIAKLDSDGFHGIATNVANIMPVRVLNESGSGTLLSVTRGIVWAADHGAQIGSLSLGGRGYSRALHDGVKYAVNDKKMLLVCAKGNSGNQESHYPSDFPEVVRVTATSLHKDGTESRAFFSSYNEKLVCVAAPGHFIYSTIPNNKKTFYSGTSMSTPHVSACAAVILSQNDLTPEQTTAILQDYGDKIKTDKPIGLRINLLKFVQKTKHDSISVPDLVNHHPYGQCCADAGIVARFTSSEENGLVRTLYQDTPPYIEEEMAR